MDLRLSGDVCVVVGGASGIGRAIVHAFVDEGCQVGVVDCDRQRLQELDGANGIHVFHGDITDAAAMAESRAHFSGLLGRVDHVVVAAGAGSGKFGYPFWRLDPSDWVRAVEVNLLGPVNVAHAYAPGLAEQGSGTLLFLVSVAAQIGSQTDPPYSAAKAGLVNFMQCAARDLAANKVRVNALSPGMVKTPLNESVWAASQAGLPAAERQDYAAWAEAKIRKIAPLGQWQSPAEFGAMAVFLASPHARSITGQTVNIDGGQVMHS